MQSTILFARMAMPVRGSVVFRNWIDAKAQDSPDNSRLQRHFGTNQGCPFLALWAQQRRANGRERRHKAKVGKRRIPGVMMRDPAAPNTPRQRAANVVWFAC